MNNYIEKVVLKNCYWVDSLGNRVVAPNLLQQWFYQFRRAIVIKALDKLKRSKRGPIKSPHAIIQDGTSHDRDASPGVDECATKK